MLYSILDQEFIMKPTLALTALAFTFYFVSLAHAEIVTKSITYTQGGVELEGFLAYDSDKAKADAPGVLIVHQWMGLTDNEKMRAKMLAELGYVAFALDIYGKGDRPANRGEAGKFAGKYKGDRKLFRQRLAAGLKVLQSQSNVNQKKLAAIGYCFGGTGVLEIARMGAPVLGVVSFHGGLGATLPAEEGASKTKVLVLHGADDPFVPKAEIEGFVKEMNDGKFDWQMTYYSGAVHSFTQKEAGNDNSAGAAYNAAADARSWGAMKQFLNELFGQ